MLSLRSILDIKGEMLSRYLYIIWTGHFAITWESIHLFEIELRRECVWEEKRTGLILGPGSLQ